MLKHISTCVFLCILSEWMLLRCFFLFIEIFGWMLLRCFCLCFFTFKRSRLRNKFSKSKSEADKKNYVKERNYCVCLLTRTKKEYYRNLDPWKVVNNRTFWRRVKPFLSNKSVENEKIILVEKEEILTKDNSVAKVLNNFFSNIVKTLGISDYTHSHPLAKEVNDPTLRAIMK